MTAQNNDFCPEMLSALLNANSILLCTHAQPDGDAIGSTLAMSTLSIIPATIIFLIFQKSLVEGIATTGIKG